MIKIIMLNGGCAFWAYQQAKVVAVIMAAHGFFAALLVLLFVFLANQIVGGWIRGT